MDKEGESQVKFMRVKETFFLYKQIKYKTERKMEKSADKKNCKKKMKIQTKLI